MKYLTLITILLVMVFTVNAQDSFIAQDFEEATTDEWNYTPEPEELQRVILWGRMNQPTNNITAQSGDWCWTSWDLDNIEHSLVFDSVQLPFGEVYTLNFYYYPTNLNPSTDYVKYAIEYDNGTEWNNWITLEANLTGWTQVSIDIPVNESQVRLKVSAKYDGWLKYALFDNFMINIQPAPLIAPLVNLISASQRTDGSKLVDITYDLFDANNDLCDISLFLSQDGGATYTYAPNRANLSGDAGEGVTPGVNKEIIWDAGNENQVFSADNYYVQVKAEDSKTAIPIILPEAGTYDEAQAITITCQTPDVEIFYTLDNSDPDQSSTLYYEAFILSTNTTVKARAYKVDWVESEIASAEYIINTEFVLVEGGTFTMGITNGSGDSDELPTHQVTLSSFYIGIYEVSQVEYHAVMNTNPSYFSNSYKPVEQVSWYNAVEYCNARSIQEGLTPCYDTTDWFCDFSANGYRLPTEAEWEYAARGATNNPDYLYAGSDDINSVAWYFGSTTHNVGTKAPNRLGIYDMSGNVWEWCNDWYGAYFSSPQDGPVGPDNGSSRVCRGGSWYDGSATYCRVASRNSSNPANSNKRTGFRLTRSSE